jgi:CBS-domain-containing membrane protein
MSFFSSPKTSLKNATISAIGIFLCIAACGYLSQIAGVPLLIASFGATAFAVIAMPSAPISQPINVLGGYFLAIAATFMAKFLLSHEIYSLALCVAFAGLLMLFFRVSHPPAAGVPIIIFFMEPRPSPDFAIFPVMAGALLLVIIAFIYNKLVNKK